MNQIMLKNYIKLLIKEENCCGKKVIAVTSNTDGPYCHDPEMLELDNDKGKIVEKDVRKKIKDYFLSMGMLPSKKK